ncbi:MAG: amidohydrolase family protein [Eubacteriales bacterium]|nr:amidohydrolase family protein [Eubacteriales bacterium]
MVIDFHTHCFADAIAKTAVPILEEACDVKTVHSGTVRSLKAHMDSCGVDISVVLPVATKPSQVCAINEWAKATADESLVFFGALHPGSEDFYDIAAQLKKDGFKGIKLHPDYQHFFADEARLMPLYEALRDLGLILALHSGIDIGYPSPVHCTPLMIKNIMDTVPGLTIVAAHMGAHGLWRDAEELLLGLPVYLDTSYSYYLLKNEGMTRMIRKHGSERVLFGTDSPWTSADDEIAAITSLDLPPGDIDNILYKNALSLLR